MYRILDASFRNSVFDLSTLPEPSLPEAAFIGRSNVGKSSLLNAICERKGLARTSKTPGRTQSFNFYQLDFLEEAEEKVRLKRAAMFFVDLPGYGYAEAPKNERKKWPQMIENYLTRRPNLQALVLLIDSRRVPREEEQWIADLGREGDLFIALTKADKLTVSAQKAAKKETARALQIEESRVVLTSTAKTKQGINELRQAVLSLGALEGATWL